jgi:hypothetical protein
MKDMTQQIVAALDELHQQREVGALVALRDGTAFSYDGVSVLESHSDTIDAFRTYYDTAAFL